MPGAFGAPKLNPAAGATDPKAGGAAFAESEKKASVKGNSRISINQQIEKSVNKVNHTVDRSVGHLASQPDRLSANLAASHLASLLRSKD